MSYLPYYKMETSFWWRAFHHPLNPFGNWHEPMPHPEKNREKAPDNEVLAFLWWNFVRNPLHNFTHFWIGITPKEGMGQWISPECRGWYRIGECWVKGKKKRCRKKFVWGKWEAYIGWSKRGSWGVAFRRAS